MKIRTIIVDDERNARKALANMLGFYCSDVELVGEAGSMDDGITLIENEKPDLVLLDIVLGKNTGFDLLKKIKKINFKLIFVTAHDEYALRAIKMSALDYILKPIKPKELISGINKVSEVIDNEEKLRLKVDALVSNTTSSNTEKRIIVNTVGSIYVLEVKNIVRCESDENYTLIHLSNAPRIMVARTLKDFEEMLVPHGFFRVHQSHLVNLDFISSFEKGSGGHILLKDGQKIPVSTRRKDSFLKALSNL